MNLNRSFLYCLAILCLGIALAALPVHPALAEDITYPPGPLQVVPGIIGNSLDSAVNRIKI